MFSLPPLADDDLSTFAGLFIRRLKEAGELGDSPLAEIPRSQALDILAAAPDEAAAFACVRRGLSEIYRLADAYVWKIAVAEAGDALIEHLDSLEFAISHLAESGRDTSALETAIAHGGILRNDRLRANVLAFAWQRERLDLQEAVRRAGGMTEDSKALIFVIHNQGEGREHAMLPACFAPAIMPRMLDMAANNNPKAFRLFLRYVTARDQLPAPTKFMKKAAVEQLERISTAHGFIAWRKGGIDWLKTALADYPEAHAAFTGEARAAA